MTIFSQKNRFVVIGKDREWRNQVGNSPRPCMDYRGDVYIASAIPPAHAGHRAANGQTSH